MNKKVISKAMKISNFPKNIIIKNLEDVKFKLASVNEFSKEDLNEMYNNIANVNVLNDIKERLIEIVNKGSDEYLRSVGLAPIPYEFLPKRRQF